MVYLIGKSDDCWTLFWKLLHIKPGLHKLVELLFVTPTVRFVIPATSHAQRGPNHDCTEVNENLAINFNGKRSWP